jgi:hypothetical protein
VWMEIAGNSAAGGVDEDDEMKRRRRKRRKDGGGGCESEFPQKISGHSRQMCSLPPASPPRYSKLLNMAIMGNSTTTLAALVLAARRMVDYGEQNLIFQGGQVKLRR